MFQSRGQCPNPESLIGRPFAHSVLASRKKLPIIIIQNTQSITITCCFLCHHCYIFNISWSNIQKHGLFALIQQHLFFSCFPGFMSRGEKRKRPFIYICIWISICHVQWPFLECDFRGWAFWNLILIAFLWNNFFFLLLLNVIQSNN